MQDVFLWLIGAGGAGLAALYIHDRTQKKHAVLRNFPIYGRFRYWLEASGEYVRQYALSNNWEERPFDRLTRAWVYRSAKGVSNKISFGSERNPEFIFKHSAFPLLDEETSDYPGKQIGVSEGPGACARPYVARSFFHISGMSYGSLSHAAVSALSRGAQVAGCWMATGEGGLSQHHLAGGADIVAQIGTAKYGYRDAEGNLDEAKVRAAAALPQVKMFELKLGQGAKPGAGGILPAAKVTEEIAQIRGIPMGRDSISPARHRDIGSVKELGDAVRRLREVSGRPVGVKFVVGQESFLDEWFADCVRRPECCPDYVHVDGAEGGTGAAPAALAEYVGVSITQALPLVVAARGRFGLRDRVRIVAAGKLVTPEKVAWALAMGADFVVSGRGFLFSLGCIQAMRCASGHCPTGVTASDPRLIEGLDPTEKSTRVANYQRRVHEEVQTIAHACGLRHAGELRVDHVTEVERGVSGFRGAS